jgi:hypothetical protein
MLSTAARNYFWLLEVLNRLKGNGSGNGSGNGNDNDSMRRVKSFARRWKFRVAAGAHVAKPGGQAGAWGRGP